MPAGSFGLLTLQAPSLVPGRILWDAAIRETFSTMILATQWYAIRAVAMDSKASSRRRDLLQIR